jgi:hypothetical protein
VGRNSVVYIAAGYGLDGLGIESSGAYSASYTIGTGPFSGVKRPDRGVNHVPTSSDEVKESVVIHLPSSGGS